MERGGSGSPGGLGVTTTSTTTAAPSSDLTNVLLTFATTAQKNLQVPTPQSHKYHREGFTRLASKESTYASWKPHWNSTSALNEWYFKIVSNLVSFKLLTGFFTHPSVETVAFVLLQTSILGQVDTKEWHTTCVKTRFRQIIRRQTVIRGTCSAKRHLDLQIGKSSAGPQTKRWRVRQMIKVWS